MEIIDNIRTFVRDYVKENNLKCLVLGISGGLDSAIVAALCQEKFIGVPLYGMSIPINSSEVHIERAIYVGDVYCSKFQVNYTFDKEFNQIKNYFDASYFTDVTDDMTIGNIKARLRMMALYDLAKKAGGAVLSTDNFSEYNAGFWTLHGDVGDIAPIQSLWKGLELPMLARQLGIREDIIEAKPSDGLAVTDEDTDEAQIGMDYITFDKQIQAYLRNERTDSPLYDIAVARYLQTAYKRRGCVFLSRKDLSFT